KASHVGKIDKRRRRRKVREEFGKLGSVLVEVGAHRRPLVYEGMSSPLEELIADQAVDCRVGQAQGVDQVAGERIAINGKTPLRSEPIVNDIARRHAVLALDEAHPNGILKLTQRRHEPLRRHELSGGMSLSGGMNLF